MRNSRNFTGAFVVALMMAGVLGFAQPASANTGPGGPDADACTFLNGILFKVGAPETVGKVLEQVFGCTFTYL